MELLPFGCEISAVEIGCSCAELPVVPQAPRLTRGCQPSCWVSPCTCVSLPASIAKPSIMQAVW